MIPMNLKQSAGTFLDEFVRVFARLSGDAVAELFASPFLALHADRTSDLCACPADTARYFQRFLDAYHGRGCRSCRYEELEVMAIGGSHVLATVTWQLLDGGERQLDQWRESYILAWRSGKLLIAASVDH